MQTTIVRLALFVFLVLSSIPVANAIPAQSPNTEVADGSGGEACAISQDCNADGFDDRDGLSIIACVNSNEHCSSAGKCEEPDGKWCIVDSHCLKPKICNKNACVDPVPGLVYEGGPYPNVFDEVSAMLGGGNPQPPARECPYGYYKASATQCRVGCSTDIDCIPNVIFGDARCRTFVSHTKCVQHANTCVQNVTCTITCKRFETTTDDGPTGEVSYRWTGLDRKRPDLRCIPEVSVLPDCTKELSEDALNKTRLGNITYY